MPNSARRSCFAIIFGIIFLISNLTHACVEISSLPDTESACVNGAKTVTHHYNCKDCCILKPVWSPKQRKFILACGNNIPGSSCWGCPPICGGSKIDGACNPSSCQWHAEISSTEVVPCTPVTSVSYKEVMKVDCPAPLGQVRIAGIKNGLSPMKIQKSDGVYGIELVDPVSDPTNASCVRVQVPSLGTRAFRKCGASDCA